MTHKKIALNEVDMNYIADQINFVEQQLNALDILASSSKDEDIQKISYLLSPMEQKLADIKDEFLRFIEKAEAKE